MGKNDRLSRDQKRKAKLKKRSEKSRAHESLAYHGAKYRSAAFVPIIHRTEIGIYESYVLSDRTLTDDDVEEDLGRLIGQLRAKSLPSPKGPGGEQADDDGEDRLILWSIRRNWQILADRGSLPGRDDLIGVLRTILSSLETRRSMNLNARGYLHFLEDFMKQTGVKVERVRPEELSSLGIEESELRQLDRPSIDDGLPG
jgi:hypothetical protein